MPVTLEEEEDLLSFDVGAVITKAAAEQEAMYVPARRVVGVGQGGLLLYVPIDMGSIGRPGWLIGRPDFKHTNHP